MAHARCLAVHPYTVAEEADMQDLICLGVDGVSTDFPNRLEAVLGGGRLGRQPRDQRGRRGIAKLPS